MLILLLGSCPALAATGNVLSALVMGVSLIIIMTLTGAVLSALKNVIGEKLRLLACVVVAGGFSAIVEMAVHALLPSVYPDIALYLMIAAVLLCVYKKAEEAAEQSVGQAAVSALVTGAVLTAAFVIIAVVREVFGLGSFAGIAIPFLESHTVSVLAKAPGGFIAFAVLAAVVNAVMGKKKEEAK